MMRALSGTPAFAALFAYGVTAGSAFAGGSVCLVSDPIWRAGHSSTQSALIAAVDTMASTIATESLLTAEALTSAMRVATRQTSLNSEREANAEMSSVQAASNVYVEQRSAELIREAYETYGQQGQMVGGCGMIEALQAADDAMRGRMDRIGTVLSSGGLDGVPGAAVAPLDAAANRLAADTAAAVSAVAFLAPDTSSADRDAFMNNVIGLPFQLPEGIGGAEDEIAFMQSRRWEAMRSPAIVSLAAVRTAAEPTSHGGAAGEMSYLEAADWYLAQFGGGPQYEEWSANLVTLSEVGLRKEIARLRAISLRLSQYGQESDDRQTAIIATLLAGVAVQ
ncbi:MAG: hypothetical protein IH568_01390 [Burkholderiaceae bacterium]|nr:hypothetical protein [Burkholderiaceae bacterium]